MAGIGATELSDSKLALLLGTDLFSLAGNTSHEVAAYNKTGARSIEIKVRLKECKGLLKIPPAKKKANLMASGHRIRSINAILKKKITRVYFAPGFPGLDC